MNKIEINLSKCRWMLFTKNNKLITENHNQGITWKNVYKQEHNNFKAVCFQLIPSGKKIFVKESPYAEYWTFEEFELVAGQTVPTHLSRNLCSMKDKDLGLWDVLSVDAEGKSKNIVMTSNEIGYEVRSFLNKEDKEKIRRGV